MTLEFKHNYAQANGIRIHYVEIGEGPLVVLLHGFPECWYAWRHQLPALAAAGFHVVAPDMRGYGRTDCPGDVEAYDIFQLTGDIVGLVNALAGTAVVVGHDWGSWLYQLSGEAAPQERWSPVQDPGALMTGAVATPKLPSFLTEQDLDFVSGEFEHSRFTGGLNYYRNMDRNWAATPFWTEQKSWCPPCSSEERKIR